MDLNKIKKVIDELVYRKKPLPLDSPEYQLINRMLDQLAREACSEAEGARAAQASGSNQTVGTHWNARSRPYCDLRPIPWVDG